MAIKALPDGQVLRRQVVLSGLGRPAEAQDPHCKTLGTEAHAF